MPLPQNSPNLLFSKRQMLGVIIPGLWVAGTKSPGPSKLDPEVRQGNKADREIAEIQTANSGCLKPVLSWSTPSTPTSLQVIKVIELNLSSQERTKSHIFTNGGGEAISKNLELKTQLADKICKRGSGIQANLDYRFVAPAKRRSWDTGLVATYHGSLQTLVVQVLFNSTAYWTLM